MRGQLWVRDQGEQGPALSSAHRPISQELQGKARQGVTGIRTRSNCNGMITVDREFGLRACSQASLQSDSSTSKPESR